MFSDHTVAKFGLFGKTCGKSQPPSLKFGKTQIIRYQICPVRDTASDGEKEEYFLFKVRQ